MFGCELLMVIWKRGWELILGRFPTSYILVNVKGRVALNVGQEEVTNVRCQVRIGEREGGGECAIVF